MVLFLSEKPLIINPVPLDSCQVAEEKPWERAAWGPCSSRDDEEVQASWAWVSEGQAQTGSLSVQQGDQAHIFCRIFVLLLHIHKTGFVLFLKELSCWLFLILHY